MSQKLSGSEALEKQMVREQQSAELHLADVRQELSMKVAYKTRQQLAEVLEKHLRLIQASVRTDEVLLGLPRNSKSKCFDRSNLVVLMFEDDNCYTKAVSPDHPKVKACRAIINEQNGTWTAQKNGNLEPQLQTWKIGESRYIERSCHYGIIGVYDRTNLTHLTLMLRASQAITERNNDYSSGD